MLLLQYWVGSKIIISTTSLRLRESKIKEVQVTPNNIRLPFSENPVQIGPAHKESSRNKHTHEQNRRNLK